MKKFPRMEVIEKQLAVVADEESELLTEEELAEVQGGNVARILGQMTVMYGVPRPPAQWLQGLLGGQQGGNGGNNQSGQ